MEFDWRRAIDRYSEDLCAIAARLIVMAGIQAGRTAPTLPRRLYWRILSLLRHAEYAARRLIVMAACKLVTITMPTTEGRRRRPPNSVILGLCETLRRAADTAPGATLPAFQLFDPFKRTGHPWLEPDGIAADEDTDFPPALPPDEPVDAKTLCRRIRALANALSDLEGQALRLARWRARRHMESARPRRWSPLRPGRPPGIRKRPKTPIGELLKDCHALARDAWNTS
jgi:hypothetical protein